jgi:hypothetical protein
VLQRDGACLREVVSPDGHGWPAEWARKERRTSHCCIDRKNPPILNGPPEAPALLAAAIPSRFASAPRCPRNGSRVQTTGRALLLYAYISS